MSERQHSVAAICIKGHVASDGIEYRSAGKFCEDCVAPVITACPGCQTPIKGFPRDVLSPPTIRLPIVSRAEQPFRGQPKNSLSLRSWPTSWTE